jgi:cytochrome c5
MKRIFILLAVGLVLAACDSNIQPTKAPVLDQTPQANPAPATGGDQPTRPQ